MYKKSTKTKAKKIKKQLKKHKNNSHKCDCLDVFKVVQKSIVFNANINGQKKNNNNKYTHYKNIML